MSKYLETNTQVVNYTNLNGDTRQVIITPVGYFNTIKGLRYLKSRVPFKELLNEFFKGENSEEDFNIEVLIDFIFDANEHLEEAGKFFLKEDFNITEVRDIEDLIEILKAVYMINKIGEAIKNLMGSQAKKGKQ